MANSLIEKISSIGGLVVEIWSDDLQHATEGHPEVTRERVKNTLKDPSRVIQSKSSNSTCLFYSGEIRQNEAEVLFFCVVVAVNGIGHGKMITAYETDFLKTGKKLYSKRGGKSES